VKYKGQINQTIWAYDYAIRYLDPDNSFIKKRDSLIEVKNRKLDSLRKQINHRKS